MGASDGEGLLHVYLGKAVTGKAQHVDITLEIGQASHDIRLLYSFKNFFNAGSVSPVCDHTNLDSVMWAKSIYKCRDVRQVIEFINKYPLLTDKQLSFKALESIYNIKQAKGHNTPEGLATIKLLKAGMNRGLGKSDL